MTTLPTSHVPGDIITSADINAIAAQANQNASDIAAEVTNRNAAIAAQAALDSAHYAAGVSVGAPTGGDDTALLTAALTGTAHVTLQPGAVYNVTTGPSSAFPAFSGKISGNGATINFSFLGPYIASARITTWTDVTVEGVTFTGGALVGGIFGPGCKRLTFRDCKCYDLTTAFSLPIDSDLTIENSRFYQSASPPSGVNQNIQGPNGGKFIVKGNTFDFAPTSSAGAIVGTISAVPTAGSSVEISGNRFLTSDASGYTIDAAIDIEPAGSVPYELVTVKDNVIYNGSVYVTGAARINVHHNRFRFTPRRGSIPRMIAVIIYNSQGTQPATGIVDIADNDVWQEDAALGYSTYLWRASVPVTEVRSRKNRVRLNTTTTAPTEVWDIAASSERVVIEGDRVENGSGTKFASVVAARLSYLPSKSFSMRDTRINGKFFAVLGSQGGTAQTCALQYLHSNDFVDLLVNSGAAPTNVTYIYNDTFGTFTKTRLSDNAGLDF